mgnify:CR=1 FL=1
MGLRNGLLYRIEPRVPINILGSIIHTYLLIILTLLPRLALLLLEEGEVLGVAGLRHLFAGDEAEGCAIDAVA